MRLLWLVVLTAVCIGSGCAWRQLSTQPTPQSPDEQLDELVRTINDNADPLHFSNTPSVRKLIEIGEPAIPRMLDLMLSEDEGTRLHALNVLSGVMSAKHGRGKYGWPDTDSEQQFAAFWKSLGDLQYDAPRKKRERAVKLWRAWLAAGAELPEK
jgi:hypothetical protein